MTVACSSKATQGGATPLISPRQNDLLSGRSRDMQQFFSQAVPSGDGATSLIAGCRALPLVAVAKADNRIELFNDQVRAKCGCVASACTAAVNTRVNTTALLA